MARAIPGPTTSVFISNNGGGLPGAGMTATTAAVCCLCGSLIAESAALNPIAVRLNVLAKPHQLMMIWVCSADSPSSPMPVPTAAHPVAQKLKFPLCEKDMKGQPLTELVSFLIKRFQPTVTKKTIAIITPLMLKASESNRFPSRCRGQCQALRCLYIAGSPAHLQ